MNVQMESRQFRVNLVIFKRGKGRLNATNANSDITALAKLPIQDLTVHMVVSQTVELQRSVKSAQKDITHMSNV